MIAQLRPDAVANIFAHDKWHGDESFFWEDAFLHKECCFQIVINAIIQNGCQPCIGEGMSVPVEPAQVAANGKAKTRSEGVSIHQRRSVAESRAPLTEDARHGERDIDSGMQLPAVEAREERRSEWIICQRPPISQWWQTESRPHSYH